MLFKELRFQLKLGTVAAKVWGDNTHKAQKFLAVHGWLDNAGSFDPLMNYLANKGRCVVCIDLLGHGHSSHLPRGIPYGAPIELQSVRQVINQLGWSKYNLIGHSLGAMRAMEYSLCWPNEVNYVITLDGFIRPSGYDGIKTCDPPFRENPYSKFGEQMDKFLKYTIGHKSEESQHSWPDLRERWRNATPALTDKELDILKIRGLTRLENGNYIQNRDAAHRKRVYLLKGSAQDIIESLKNNNTNYLHIYATDGIRKEFSSPEKESFVAFNDYLTENFPTKIKIHLAEGSHYLHMQQPRYVADAINDFLQETEPPPKSML